MRLKYQIFLSLLLSSGLLIVLMYAINSWSFNRGFLGYLNKAEIQKLAPMIDEMAAGFEQSGSWDWLTDDLDIWDSLLDKYVGKRPVLLPNPSVGREYSQQSTRSRDLVDDRTLPPPGERDQQKGVLTFDARLILANTEKIILIGPPHMNTVEGNRIWLPIESNNTITGYLGYHQIRELSGQIDKLFAAQQRSSFAYAALFMIILSGILAIALAARIVRPILRMNVAVNRISQGEYTHRINSERRDEIGDLSGNINRLATTLDQNLSARQQWLAEISHELRTPVAILQGELEAMIDNIIPVDDAAIASLHSESLRLSRLINDLHSLTVADIGALEYNFQSLDLVPVIAARCHAANTLASSRDITVDMILPAEPLIMRGDQQRLEQLFDNLLQNSVRYTDPGGTISIRMQALSECIEVSWQDSSPGVTDEQLQHIFDVLYRAETSRNRSTGGAGLGLAIARRIVQAHEGLLSASHSELGGLLLSLRFPLLPAKYT